MVLRRKYLSTLWKKGHKVWCMLLKITLITLLHIILHLLKYNGNFLLSTKCNNKVDRDGRLSFLYIWKFILYVMSYEAVDFILF